MPTSNAKEMLMETDFKRSWGWLLALGMMFVILGTIGFGMVVGITVASMFFLGVLLLIAGGAQIVDVFKSKKWRGALSHFLVAVLYLAGGALIIYDPLLASSLITAALAGVLIVIGLARIWMSMMLRAEKGWGWIFIAGLSALVLGILILLQWPVSGLWFIGLFISIELIICGWTYILLAFSIRNLP
jgi:uncharacterized membrane protein HdeD (DUF308 family)